MEDIYPDSPGNALAPSARAHDVSNTSSQNTNLTGDVQTNAVLISKRCLECQNEFKKCLTDLREPLLEWVENRQADFNLWASSIKATGSGKSSLDYRLRERPDVKEKIFDLLDGLLEAIQQIQEILHFENATQNPAGDRIKYNTHSALLEDDDSGSSEASVAVSEDDICSEEKECVQTTLRELARLSAAIRKSGSRYRFLRADNALQEQEFSRFKTHLTNIILISHFGNELAHRNQTSQLAKMVHLPQNRFENLTHAQKRLIDANIRRRNRIHYATRNTRPAQVVHPKDARKRVSIYNDVAGISLTPWLQEQVKAPPSQPPTTTAKSESPSHISTTKTKSSNPTATEMSRSFDLTAAIKQDTPSVVTKATQIATSLEYPKCPKPTSDELIQCPWCGDILPVDYHKSESKWKGHVAHDVLPYTCVVENCTYPAEEMFLTSEDLLKHIREHHGLTRWVCDYCPIERALIESAFSSPMDLEHHIIMMHAGLFPHYQISILAGFSKRIVVEPLCCPICGQKCQERVTAGLDDHALQHIHEFSLRSLPWDIANGSGEESCRQQYDTSRTTTSLAYSYNISGSKFNDEEGLLNVEVRSDLRTSLVPLLREVTGIYKTAPAEPEEEIKIAVGTDTLKGFYESAWEIPTTASQIRILVDEIANPHYEIQPNVGERWMAALPKLRHVLSELSDQRLVDQFARRPGHGTIVKVSFLSHDLKDILGLLNQSQLRSYPIPDSLEVPENPQATLSPRVKSIRFLPELASLQADLGLDSSERRLLYEGNLTEKRFSPHGIAVSITFYAFLFDNYLILTTARQHPSQPDNQSFIVDDDSNCIPLPLVSHVEDFALPVDLHVHDDMLADVICLRWLKQYRYFQASSPQARLSFTTIINENSEKISRDGPFCLLPRVSDFPSQYPAERIHTTMNLVVKDGNRTSNASFTLHNMPNSTITQAHCATGISHALLLIGTTDGIWLVSSKHGKAMMPDTTGETSDRISTQKKIVGSDPRKIWQGNVTQIAVIETRDKVLFLSDENLFECSLSRIITSGTLAPRKTAPFIIHFATTVEHDDTLVLGLRKQSKHSSESTITIFETPWKDEAGRSGYLDVFEPSLREWATRGHFGISFDCSSLAVGPAHLLLTTSEGFKTVVFETNTAYSCPDFQYSNLHRLRERIEQQKSVVMLPFTPEEAILVYESCAIYIGNKGEPSRPNLIKFLDPSQKVQRATMCERYLILFTHSFIEIRDVDNGQLRQVIRGSYVRCLDEGFQGAIRHYNNRKMKPYKWLRNNEKHGSNQISLKGSVKFIIAPMGHPDRPAIVELALEPNGPLDPGSD